MTEILKGMNPLKIADRDKGVRRIVMLFASILLMGFGISLFSYSDMGVDPFTAMNMAISARVHMGFGLYQMFVNAILLLAVALFAKKLISIGTIVNMVGVGYICEFFTKLYDNYLPAENSLAVRLCFMLAGVLLLSLSASLYFTSDLGVAPYDATGFVLQDKSKMKYKWCRVITDLVCTAIGFAFGGPVGAGTVITAFMMGPVVAFFNKHVSERLLHAERKMSVFRMYDFTSMGGGYVPAGGRLI